MAAYLTEHAEQLYKHNNLDMVCNAPIDIRRKAEILEELAKNEDLEKETKEELTRLRPCKSDDKYIKKWWHNNISCTCQSTS